MTASENPSEFRHFIICQTALELLRPIQLLSRNSEGFSEGFLACNFEQFAHVLSAYYPNVHLGRIFGRIFGISIKLHQAKNAAENESENHSEISVERSNWPPALRRRRRRRRLSQYNVRSRSRCVRGMRRRRRKVLLPSKE